MKLFLIFALFLPLAAFAGLSEQDYEIVAASQTNQTLGPVGGVGDVIHRLIIVPETTAAGTVSIRDGSGNAAVYNSNVFVTGTLSDLHPILIELHSKSISGDWSVTTGTNVHVIAVGQFK